MTIWTGRYIDEVGEFEMLVPAMNREDATRKIEKALDYLDLHPDKVILSDRITGVPKLMYIEEVGTFDMVRPR